MRCDITPSGGLNGTLEGPTHPEQPSVTEEAIKAIPMGMHKRPFSALCVGVEDDGLDAFSGFERATLGPDKYTRDTSNNTRIYR